MMLIFLVGIKICSLIQTFLTDQKKSLLREQKGLKQHKI
ncbi:hypothetical protein C943_02111 [Mariniradius saccharolyticus AK6]|uniref:Uncharacterized protein n=1 Tax=Mariniradius saccharolyticus AK6 TaxID=1239962 RepID=M7Y2L8_9BACT|nr:hypothetical protein C943_02111 [Mariniradius saccharolyticus AK6]